MPETQLPPIRIAILATDGFEESELLLPRAALEEAGAKTILISPRDNEIQGMKHHDKTKKVDVDLPLADADPGEYDAVLLPGGVLNADALRVEKAAQEFVREMDLAKKPIAFICHAPWLLVSARLVKGRTLTSYHTIQDDIRNAGGNWKDQEVVRDEYWISSRQPSGIPAFNREILALFAHAKSKAKTA